MNYFIELGVFHKLYDGQLFVLLHLHHVSGTDWDLHVVKFSHSCQKLLVGEIAAVPHQSNMFHQFLRQMRQN